MHRTQAHATAASCRGELDYCNSDASCQLFLIETRIQQTRSVTELVINLPKCQKQVVTHLLQPVGYIQTIIIDVWLWIAETVYKIGIRLEPSLGI